MNNEQPKFRQYCRYCVYLCVNNVPYCNAKKQTKSESSCKRENHCKDFVFADTDPEYQDAFGETNGYKPRKPKGSKIKQIDGQMTIDTEWLMDNNVMSVEERNEKL